MDFHVVKGDISKANVDVIVVAVNKELKCEGALSEYIMDIAKCEDCGNKEDWGTCELGTVIGIGANNLYAKKIFLAVVPKWIDGFHDEEALLENVYTNSLILAEKLNCNSIAFPILGLEKKHFKFDIAINRAISSIQNYNSDVLENVLVFDKRETIIARVREKGLKVSDSQKGKYKDKSLEQLFDETESLSMMTKDDLDELYNNVKIYSKLFAPFKYRNAFSDKKIVFSRKVHDYIIEKTHKNECRISRNIRGYKIYCSEETLYFFLKLKMAEKKHLDSLVNKEFGLVLCGGGARGAYQIGACKALAECTSICFTGIAGTSVGALNELLIAQGNYEIAEKVWMNVNKEDIISINDSLKKTYKLISSLAFENQVIMRLIIVMELINEWAPMEYDFEKNDFVKKSRESFYVLKNKLGVIISNAIYDWKSIDSDKIVYSCVSTGYIKHLSKGVYIPLVDLTVDRIKDIVMASAAFPFVFKPKKISGKSFNDGGVNDNVPYKVLVENGFKKIIVIHLDEKDKKKIKNSPNTYKAVKLYHIYPSKDLGKLFDINQELTEDRMKTGYEDMIKWLGENKDIVKGV